MSILGNGLLGGAVQVSQDQAGRGRLDCGKTEWLQGDAECCCVAHCCVAWDFGAGGEKFPWPRPRRSAVWRPWYHLCDGDRLSALIGGCVP